MTTSSVDAEFTGRGGQPVPSRHTAMVDELAKVRPARAGGIRLETVLLVLGAFCLPTGLMAIVVAWYGIAHTGHVYEQNSYLISGGVFGLGLVITGGFMYFGYWMTRQLHATTAAAQQNARALDRVEEQLASMARALNGAAAPASNGSARSSARRRRGSIASRSETAMLVATRHGTLVHRAGCPVVAEKADLRPVEAGTPGYRPCQICVPQGA